MSSQAPLSDEEIADTIKRISKFKVAELKDLSRSMELRLTGKKQDLNDRIVQFLEQGKRYGDNLKLLTIRTLVLKRQNQDQLPSFKDLYSSIQSGAFNYTNVWNQYMKHDTTKPKSIHAVDSTPYKAHSLYFKESPFFQLKRMVHGSPQVAFPSKGRVVCDFNVVLTQEENELLVINDPSIRFYLLCGVQGNTSPSSTQVPLQFPNPLEIHINGNLFKENVKGIKGKPGTAKPADITSLLKQSPDLNKIQMVYTTTNDTYLLYLYIVQVISCDELIQKIVNKPHIHLNSTVSQISKNAADDDDIVVSTSVVTLKDPLSYTRMTYPAQSIYCSHVECFDALIFLESQKQLPTWNCPHCHRTINIDDLAISDYLLDIISKVSDDVDHVTINQDGTWIVEEEKKEQDKESSGNSTSVVTKKESEERIKSNDIIEIVSLDSESEDDVDTSMGRSNVPIQNPEMPNISLPTTLDTFNNASTSNNNDVNNDVNVAPIVINDSETDSDDERPLARRNRRPPIISTPSSNSDSSQSQYPQMYEFSTTNNTNYPIINNNQLLPQSRDIHSPGSISAPPIASHHPNYNQLPRYLHIQPNMQSNVQSNFQQNTHTNMTEPLMILNAGHPTPTSIHGNREIIHNNNNIPNQNYNNQQANIYAPDVNRSAIHPSILQNNPSNLYPKGFQNILMQQQRQQLSQRHLQGKYNEMTLLMQRNIKKSDSQPINSPSQSPVYRSDQRIERPSISRNNSPLVNHELINFPAKHDINTNSTILNNTTPRIFSNNNTNNDENHSTSNIYEQNMISSELSNDNSGNSAQNNIQHEPTCENNYPLLDDSTSQSVNIPMIENSPGQITPVINNQTNENQHFETESSSVVHTTLADNGINENQYYSGQQISTEPPKNTQLQETEDQHPTAESSNVEQSSVTNSQENNSGTVENHLGMRFSKSIFELSESTRNKSDNLNNYESTSNNPDSTENSENPASKKQKIVGLLGISLNDDIFPFTNVSNISTTNQEEYQVSPINGRINNIQLETPRKRSVSNAEVESDNNKNSDNHEL